jgi:hypothetical protein
MTFFYFEEECFEFLYQASVGFERLLKIVIVLSEHNDSLEQQEFEKSLITHNHLELFKRITKKHDTKLSDVHIQFLQMLTEFYNSNRYDRFGLHSAYNPRSSKNLLIGFFEKHLKLKILAELPFSTEIDERMRKFIGRTVGKISVALYNLVEDLAREMNIYTYEVKKELKATIANMKLQKMSFRTISRTLGIPLSTVHRIYKGY